MWILAIDPGAKPGYAIFGTRAQMFWGCGTTLQHVSPETDLRVRWVIVTEEVWFGPKSVKKAIAQLAFTCGRQVELARAVLGQDTPIYRLPPKAWKNAVVPSGGSLPKAVFLKRLRAKHELTELAQRNHDVADACGLALAFNNLGPSSTKKYLLKDTL